MVEREGGPAVQIASPPRKCSNRAPRDDDDARRRSGLTRCFSIQLASLALDWFRGGTQQGPARKVARSVMSAESEKVSEGIFAIQFALVGPDSACLLAGWLLAGGPGLMVQNNLCRLRDGTRISPPLFFPSLLSTTSYTEQRHVEQGLERPREQSRWFCRGKTQVIRAPNGEPWPGLSVALRISQVGSIQTTVHAIEPNCVRSRGVFELPPRWAT